MKSVLVKYDLIGEQAGAGSGEELICIGDILQSISPIDLHLRGKIRCASIEEYEENISRGDQPRSWKDTSCGREDGSDSWKSYMWW
jgi:hypothetical protein